MAARNPAALWDPSCSVEDDDATSNGLRRENGAPRAEHDAGAAAENGEPGFGRLRASGSAEWSTGTSIPRNRKTGGAAA